MTLSKRLICAALAAASLSSLPAFAQAPAPSQMDHYLGFLQEISPEKDAVAAEQISDRIASLLLVDQVLETVPSTGTQSTGDSSVSEDLQEKGAIVAAPSEPQGRLAPQAYSAE